MPADTWNRRKFGQVADLIEAHPDHFSMVTWWTGVGNGITPARVTRRANLGETWCGTTACIAGFALLSERGSLGWPASGAFYEAQGLLGLSESEAEALFRYPSTRGIALSESPAEIVVALRRVANGGNLYMEGTTHDG